MLLHIVPTSPASVGGIDFWQRSVAKSRLEMVSNQRIRKKCTSTLQFDKIQQRQQVEQMRDESIFKHVSIAVRSKRRKPKPT